MNTQLLEHYRMLRSHGQHAASALYQTKLWLKRPPLPDIKLEPYHHETATWDEDGFTLHAKLVPDYDSFDLLLGRYCDANTEGAIPRNPNKVERCSFTHFLPANLDPEYPEYAKQDLKRAEAYNDGDWMYYGIEVTASKKGIELAEEACWGFESDMEPEAFVSEASALADSAISGAKEALKSLCSKGDETC